MRGRSNNHKIVTIFQCLFSSAVFVAVAYCWGHARALHMVSVEMHNCASYWRSRVGYLFELRLMENYQSKIIITTAEQEVPLHDIRVSSSDDIEQEIIATRRNDVKKTRTNAKENVRSPITRSLHLSYKPLESTLSDQKLFIEIVFVQNVTP